jgi:organic radical activating enzyme
MKKKIEDYPWFCPQPFMNIVTDVFGKIKPCCVIKGNNKWDRNQTIEEYSKSDMLRQFRKEMLEGGGPLVESNCEICIEQEKHSPESHRRTYNKYLEYNKPELKEELEEYLETDMDTPFVRTMEWIAPTNFCNLRCHMCGSANSSSIARENQHIGHPNVGLLGNHTLYKNDEKADSFIQECDDFVIDNLVELKLTGGETLAIKYNYDLMKRIVDRGLAKDMDLRITTNGTLTPKFDGKDIFDYIPEFKECLINISIEGWDKRNEYIRYPSKWDVIYKNAERYIEGHVYLTLLLNGNLIMNNILCMKWGDKYDDSYVEKLKEQCEANCSVPFKFWCFTDKPEKDWHIPIPTTLDEFYDEDRGFFWAYRKCYMFRHGSN